MRRLCLVRAAFWLYLAALLRLTVFRAGFLSHGPFSGRVELVPFVYLWKLLRVKYYRYFCYLFFGNLLWFVPLGAYLRYRGTGLRSALAIGLALSFAIELAQFVLGSGVSEVEDLILNTAGAALGWRLLPKKCLPG